MKKIAFCFVVLIVFSCSDKIESKTTINVVDNKPDSNEAKNNEEEIEALKRKWTWNEKIAAPLKSSVSNTKFQPDLLFKKWTLSDVGENKPVLTFKKDSINIEGERKYIYTVNYDSLRIFTAYNHPGDGFTRGIITKLTKDSLIIKWSTDDINKYVPVK